MKWKFGIKLCGSVAIVVGCALMGAGSVSADSVPVPPSNLLALVSPAGLANPAIPRLPNPSCGPGQTPVTPTGAGQTADGGYLYEFVIAGKPNIVPVPPASFSPATASNAQLLEYGYQPRPAGGAALVQWEDEFANAQPSRTPPGLCLTQKTASPNLSPHASIQSSSSTNIGPNVTAGFMESGNWAGMAVDDGESFVAVQGNYTQQSAGSCGCGTSDTDESSWSGIGGLFNPALIQDGTDMNGTPSSYFAWYEYLHSCGTPGCNPPEITISGLTVGAGDSIHTYVAYASSSGETDFLVCVSGTCKSTIVYLDSSYYDPSSAEWIDERPTYSFGYKPLTNFGYNDWTTAEAENSSGTWEGVNAIADDTIAMVNSYSNTLAAPSSYNSWNSYTDEWFQAS